MGFITPAGKQRNNFRERFCMDLSELNGFLSAVPKARMHREHNSKDGKWKVQPRKYNPFTVLKYLQYSWGVGIHYTNNLSKKMTISATPNNTREAITSGTKTAKSAINNHKSAKSAINNRKAAKACYTPRFMQDQVARKESQAKTLVYESTKTVTYTWTEEAKAK